MSQLQADIKAIQDRIAVATREFHRAEATHDAARAKAANLREQLKREFGVQNLEEAAEWIQQANAELQGLVTALETALNDVSTAHRPGL